MVFFDFVVFDGVVFDYLCVVEVFLCFGSDQVVLFLCCFVLGVDQLCYVCQQVYDDWNYCDYDEGELLVQVEYYCEGCYEV